MNSYNHLQYTNLPYKNLKVNKSKNLVEFWLTKCLSHQQSLKLWLVSCLICSILSLLSWLSCLSCLVSLLSCLSLISSSPSCLLYLLASHFVLSCLVSLMHHVWSYPTSPTILAVIAVHSPSIAAHFASFQAHNMPGSRHSLWWAQTISMMLTFG